MFSHPVYNLPPQFNENSLSQNLAGLSLNNMSSLRDQQRQNIDFASMQFAQQQQQMYKETNFSFITNIIKCFKSKLQLG